MAESQFSSASNMAGPKVTFPIIVDKAIALKLLQPKDACRLFDLVHKNSHYLRQWLPWVDSVKQPRDQTAFIHSANQRWQAKETLTLGIGYHQQWVGIIGFHVLDWQHRRTSICYWLDASQQGQGIVSKACQALINVAFQQWGLTALTIHCATEHYKSQAIPWRLGFVWHKTMAIRSLCSSSCVPAKAD